MRGMPPPSNRSKLGILPFLLAWAIGGTMAIAQSSAPTAAVPASAAALARSHRSTSLGPDGGSISAVVIEPQNPRTVYAATQGNGVFKSVDAGKHRHAESQSTNTVYAACGGFPDTGLFKSTDGGAFGTTGQGARPANVTWLGPPRSWRERTNSPRSPSPSSATALTGDGG